MRVQETTPPTEAGACCGENPQASCCGTTAATCCTSAATRSADAACCERAATLSGADARAIDVTHGQRDQSGEPASLSVAVIGAGPIGLAAAAHLIARGETPIIFESGATVGASMLE